MALESGTYIDSLVATNPVATDGLAQADDHMRLIKSTIKSTFPSVTGAVTATHAELNILDGVTATNAELNLLDGVTATTAELNILDGVTATAGELNTLDGITSTATELNKLHGATATTTELNYLSGVSSNIQTQLSNLSTSVSAVNVYPIDVRVLTSGNYIIPSGAKSVLIKASGGGGGGSYHIYPTTGGSGGQGGTTTVSNGTLGISVVATGGGAGKASSSGVSAFVGGSSGGDIQLGSGAAGGDSYKANWDIAAHAGRPANLVTKFVSNVSAGGQTLSISYGAGGTAGSSAQAGAAGFVEIWVW